MATMKDVAASVGVSVSTISRALNRPEMVDEETKRRILAAADALGYKPNFMARALKEGKARIIAFLVPNIENHIYPTLVAAVEETARKRGYLVLFCNTRENKELESQYVNRFLGQSASGFLFATAEEGVQQSVEVLRELSIPVAFLMREHEKGKESFVSDGELGGYLAAKYLLDKGHRRIVTLTGRQNLLLYRNRSKGYARAMKEAGVYRPELIWSCVENGIEKAQYTVKEKLRSGYVPDAIFAESDPLAFDAILALNREGYRVPEDVSVMGFDDIAMAENFHLTTMHQPLRIMAEDAVNYLIDVIEKKVLPGQEKKVYDIRLVDRDTVQERR